MSSPAPDVTSRLSEARAGSEAALGWLLDSIRGYLLTVARRELDPAFARKTGASDLVQETMLGACRDFARFRGESEAEWLAWVHHLLMNNLITFTRRYRSAAKRDIGRERPLDPGRLPAGGAGAQPAPTPSGELMAAEELATLTEALDRLPGDYRRVILLRYQDERSFEEIGAEMGLTPNAARKLWLRAVKRMQEETLGHRHDDRRAPG